MKLCIPDNLLNIGTFLLQVNGKFIIKSGTDFRQLSKITLTFKGVDDVKVEVEELNVTSDIEEDPELKKLLEKYSGRSLVCHNYKTYAMNNIRVRPDSK